MLPLIFHQDPSDRQRLDLSGSPHLPWIGDGFLPSGDTFLQFQHTFLLGGILGQVPAFVGIGVEVVEFVNTQSVGVKST